MPTQTYPSLEAHAAAVQNHNLRATLLGKASAPWTMSRLTLPNSRVQWGQAGGANLVEGFVSPGGVSIFLPTQNAHLIRFNGRRFDTQTLRFQIPGDEICLSSTGWHGWFSMFIPYEVLAAWNRTDATAVASSSSFIRLPSDRAETFQRVVAQLGSIVQRAPGALESSAAAKTTAHKLAESVREALWDKPAATPQPGRRSVPRRHIIRAAMDCVDQHDCEHLTVSELATAAGVSERTLRAAFQEYFGVGPVGYLKRRTLNLVRKTLQNADPSVATVTQVATQFGVWELGRFAQDYRLLFGELPSATLRRQQ
jgi:AraC family ethanolamine operon transcriptional activator